ncbi:MAG: hypothetical protein RLZZ38_1734 [Bacteroidota bacterium]
MRNARTNQLNFFDMIGEKIDKNLLNTHAAKTLVDHINLQKTSHKFVVAIAGESGSGKTHMASAIQKAFSESDISASIIHMDDFFILPPASNHAQRLKDIAHVGPQEVDINRMNTLIADFKNNGHKIWVPRVSYYENSIAEIEIDLSEQQVLIVEGTYAFLLQDTDFHLFMSRNFEQTKELRLARNRGTEAQDDFIEQVLVLEHQIISKSAAKANALIDYNFNLQLK